MEFINNMIHEVENSKIAPRHRVALLSMLYNLRDLKLSLMTDSMNPKRIFTVAKGMKKLVHMSNEFEAKYLEYGCDEKKLTLHSDNEVKNQIGTLKSMVPKVPDSIKKLIKR